MEVSTKILLIILMAVMIIFSAVFSAAETAYSSVSQAKIELAYKHGKKSAILIKKHYKKFGWTLATILISNNLVNIAASSLITFLLAQEFTQSGTATIISIAVLTPILVIFGEIFPKLLAKKYSYGYLRYVAYLIEVLNWLFFPFTFPLSKMTLSSQVTNSEKELKILLKLATNEGVLEMHEATLAQKALDLDSTQAHKIMKNREEIVAINSDATVSEARNIFKSSGYSRIPVITKGGRFTGVILLKTIIFARGNEKIAKYIQKIIRVSQHSLITKTLEELRLNKIHIALVTKTLDSSEVVGLVTLEDIIEELIGEIYDEHDGHRSITQVAHFKWMVHGSLSMEELEKEVKYKFKGSDDMTVKQWLQNQINRRIKYKLRYTYKNKIIFKVISNKNNTETLIEISKK